MIENQVGWLYNGGVVFRFRCRNKTEAREIHRSVEEAVTKALRLHAPEHVQPLFRDPHVDPSNFGESREQFPST